MDSSYKFFENKECKYYPCHKNVEEINCLFCYCPLYHFEKCPGNYKIVESKGRLIKSCIDCSFPHIPDNYDKVNAIIKANNSGDIL